MSDESTLRKVSPSLESICLRGKYKVYCGFQLFLESIQPALIQANFCVLEKMGNSVDYEKDYKKAVELGAVKLKSKDSFGRRMEYLERARAGIPFCLHITAIEHLQDGVIIEIACQPAMYYMITQKKLIQFGEHQVEEARIECRRFIKDIMSTVKAEEIEPVSVYPVIPRREIKDRLLKLGLSEIVDSLDRAERHIIQNNFEESLKCSRTAFEKMVAYQMKKRGLPQTDTTGHDLDRMASKGFFGEDISEVFKSYYHFLSNVGVHEKAGKPSIYEAQMGYGITLIALDYMSDKFA
mgnify:CR=1 FL=1